jgi:hypothetical protein
VRSSISVGNLSQASAGSIHRSTSLHDRGQRLESPRLHFEADYHCGIFGDYGRMITVYLWQFIALWSHEEAV